jgi:hypothetical protein
MSTKYNYNEPNNFGFLYLLVYDQRIQASTFTPALNYDLDYVVVEGKRTGNPVSVDMDIYACDGNHKPTGSSLVKVTKLQADIPTSEAEITFTLASSISLSSGVEYAVVMSAPLGSSPHRFNWAYLNSGNTAGFGTTSNDGGSSWITPTLSGDWFQAWGTESFGASIAHTPDPTNGESDLDTGGVDLSWVDDNPGDSYDIYFGPTGSMVLLESAWGSTSYSYTPYLSAGQEYSWRIDINIGEEVVTGAVWTFTTESLIAPSTNLATIKRLIVASNDEIWYEDI